MVLRFLKDVVCEDFGSNCMRCGNEKYPENADEPTRIGYTKLGSGEACIEYCKSMGASCCHYMNCTDNNCFCGAYSNYKPNETPVCGAVAKTKFASKCYRKGGN